MAEAVAIVAGATGLVGEVFCALGTTMRQAARPRRSVGSISSTRWRWPERLRLEPPDTSCWLLPSGQCRRRGSSTTE